MSFVMDNVVGTCNMLDFARWNMQERPGCRFLYFSTDEVFGPASPGHPGFREWDRYNCRNPYAASKAGGEELTLAFGNTYGLKILITHTMNVIGERQHPEKYVPSTIRKVLDGEEVVIHSDPTETIPGSRFYIHARNVASAVLFLLLHGEPGEKYNIVGEREVDNLQMAVMIAHILNRPLKYRLVNFHSSRPGHDLRYALSGKRMQDMGWSPPVKFEESLTRTVEWSVRHPQWL